HFPINGGGWHFTWQGDNNALRKKVSAYCHEEHDRADLMCDQHLDDRRNSRTTVVNSDPLHTLPLELLPKPIQDNLEKYRHQLVDFDPPPPRVAADYNVAEACMK